MTSSITEVKDLEHSFGDAKAVDEVRHSIGVVPQEYTADEGLSGYENLMLRAGLYGFPRPDAKKRAYDLLSLVELGDAANRSVETYSGGA